MREDIRRTVAYAAAGHANGRYANSIYSYHRHRYSNMSKNYDYEASCSLSGMDSGRIYHYGVCAHITLKMNGNSFSGYDYESGSNFSGTVSGRTVQLYDYSEGRYFNYSV